MNQMSQRAPMSRRAELTTEIAILLRQARSDFLPVREALEQIWSAVSRIKGFYKEKYRREAWRRIQAELPPFSHLLTDTQWQMVLSQCPDYVHESVRPENETQDFLNESLRCLLARLIYLAGRKDRHDQDIVVPMSRALRLMSCLCIDNAKFVYAWRERFGVLDQVSGKKFLPPDVSALLRRLPKQGNHTRCLSLANYERSQVLAPLGCAVSFGTGTDGWVRLLVTSPEGEHFHVPSFHC